ncbi:MAG: leucine-rich repeat domain-containing protein [Candidatus Nanoarchaeia archaeon]|jgi:Leucine-rich repeat (LRR) protein
MYLSLSCQGLKSVPSYVTDLDNLEKLDLGWNQLSDLPKLPLGLKSLYCHKNSFTKIPESVRDLTSLEELFFWDNQLTSVPNWIGELTNLKRLSLTDNNLVLLPESINQLELHGLYLQRNKLQSLPNINCSHIGCVLFGSNPITDYSGVIHLFREADDNLLFELSLSLPRDLYNKLKTQANQE